MAVTENSYTGNGSTTNYSFTFPYLKSTDVQVQVDATVTTAWAFANATTVQFNTAPSNGAKIKILRDTNVDSLAATFYAGSSIKSEDLNDNYTQNLYKTQEVGARYFSTTGGTMTGDLTLGEDVTLTFEGATDNTNETKLTVADPTADRTITLPDTTGTIVTTGDTGTVATGMIAADAVNGTKIADDSINSEHYVDGSIDTVHIADNQITTAKIADNQVTTAKIADANVTTAKIADNAVTMAKLNSGTLPTDITVASANLVDGTIATADIADNAVTMAKLNSGALPTDITVASANLVDGTVATADIADANITTAKIADSNITTAKIADDAVNGNKIASNTITNDNVKSNAAIDGSKLANTSITHTQLSANSVTTAKITDGNVTTAKIADSNVTTAKIAANAVTSAKIADDAVGSTELGDGVIDTVHVGAAQITTAKLADSNVTTAKITDANVTTAKIADDAITIGKIGCEQTTLSNSDSHIPTSGAVVDYVAAQIAPLGGLEVIATEVAFPNTQPSAGVVISISDAGGVVFNGSGTSTTGRTVGGSTVTINNAPSSLNSETLVAGVGLMVSSTGSSQTYNYHKILGKEDDIKQLSDDINDFNARYRVGSSNPTSALDAGDLFFNTSTQKLLVYNSTNSAWEEAQSIGNFFISTFSEAFDGSRTQFTLSNAPTNVQQILLSLNGVVQKPGTAFTLSGSTVTLASAPASGTDFFAVVMGSTVNIGTPSNNTVATAVLQDDAVTSAKIAASNVTATELGANAVITSKIADSNVTTAKIADDAVTGDKIANNLDIPDNNKIRFGTGNDLQIYHEGSDSWIRDAGTGRLLIDGSEVHIRKYGAAETMAKFIEDGAVELYHNNSKKFETTSEGALFSGAVGINGTNLTHAVNTLKIGHEGSGVHQLRGYGPDTSTNGKIQLRSSRSNGSNSFDIVYDSGNLEFPDNQKAIFGTGDDLQIYHDGTHSRFLNNTGLFLLQGSDIRLANTAGTETIIKGVENGAVELYYDDSKKFETTSNGATVSGRLDTQGLFTGDNNKILAGNSDDLEIYHNGSHSIAKNGTGDFYLAGDSVKLVNAAINEDMLVAEANGAVKLYYNNNLISATGSGHLDQYARIKIHAANSGGGFGGHQMTLGTWDGSNHRIEGDANRPVYLVSYNSTGIKMGISGGVTATVISSGIMPHSNNSVDLGSSSLKWRNIYTNDLNLSNEGSSNDVDGTWGNWTIQEGESDLFLKNNRSGKKYKFNLTEVS